METPIEARQRREAFRKWKAEVRKTLPEKLVKFYQNADKFDAHQHKMVGMMVMDLNNPMYAYTDFYGKRLEAIGETAAEVMLEIEVDNFTKLIESL